jgi:hypothetical protein
MWLWWKSGRSSRNAPQPEGIGTILLFLLLLFIIYFLHPVFFLVVPTRFSYYMRVKWFDPYNIKKQNGVVCWDLIVEGY